VKEVKEVKDVKDVNPEGEPARSNAELVREFHRASGSGDSGIPSLPSAGVLELRRRLISEEHNEVMQALARLEAGETGDDALAHLAHELADLLYVTYGTLVACGVEPDGVFRELHRANMHKVSGPRREDGKQMKPPGWEPADVRAEISRQQKNGSVSG
jgi:predicted HAD superfamily Cof-like phosphohydrolase